jgi:hypothetical protein
MFDFLNTADFWKWSLLMLAGLATMLCTWIGTQALFPKFIRAAQESYDHLWLNLGVGALVAGGIGLVGGLVQLIPYLGPVVCAVAGSALSAVALAGSAGLARRVGSGMLHPTDKEQPWRRTMRGAVVLLGTCCVPGVNIIPLSFILLVGLGAALRSLQKMRTERQAAGGEE